MKGLTGILTLVVGILAAIAAIYEFFQFTGSPGREGHTNHLWMAIAAFVIFCVCLLLYFVRRVNKEEEIHITS